METSAIIAKAQRCLALETDALQATSRIVGEHFVQVVRLMNNTLDRNAKLIFTGIGKSAHICEKLVGTFNSIGAPSTFIDPVRALHGDLGLCRQGDTLLAFSNGGETEEVIRLVNMVQRFGIETVAVTAQRDSSLAKLCPALLPYSAEVEACPLELAPTASTTACMAIGDAAAMVLLEMRAVKKEDFARFHPGGSIGKTLVPRVESVMRKGDRFSSASEEEDCRSCIEKMSKPNSGSIALTDSEGKLSGVLTDGDIRRLILSQPDFLDKPVKDYMTQDPITIATGSLAADALKIFERHSINDLIVVDADGTPIGLIDGQDLTKVRMV